MLTTPTQLHQWLLEPEGQRLEFKEAKQRYDFEKLLKYCVARPTKAAAPSCWA